MSTLQTAALMLGGFILGEVVLTLLYIGYAKLTTRRLMKSSLPQLAVPEKMCKGPHSWITARTITKDGPGTTQVCRACGFISGTNKLVSMESIDRIEESNRIREVENKLLKDFLAKEDDTLKKYFDLEIKAGLSFEKLTHIHGAGMTFSQRFLVYKESKAEEIKKELTKSDA